MHVKKGDKVIVTTGKNKGAKGEIIKAYPKMDKVLIAGVNIKKHHEKSRTQGKKGQIVEKPAPIHVSNVKLDR